MFNKRCLAEAGHSSTALPDSEGTLLAAELMLRHKGHRRPTAGFEPTSEITKPTPTINHTPKPASLSPEPKPDLCLHTPNHEHRATYRTNNNHHNEPHHHQMSWAHNLSAAAATVYGGLCIASALPFAGVSIPWVTSRRRGDSWVAYYAEKNAWMARLSGDRLTPRQAGLAGAALRVAVGACCIWGPPVREAALLVNGAIVARGTVLAARDGRPMRPQWTMLGAIGLCLLLGRL